MASKLLKVVIGEGDRSQGKKGLLYQEITQFLWQKGFPGLTVIEAKAGLNEKASYVLELLANNVFNNLPIIIESVHSEHEINRILPELDEKVNHGEIAVMDAYLDHEEGEYQMDSQTHLLLKIYIKEETTIFSKPLYEKISEKLADDNLTWTTITKGIEGFGKDHTIYKERVFSFSDHTPIVIESLGTKETIKKVIKEIKPLVKDGLVITIPTQLYFNG